MKIEKYFVYNNDEFLGCYIDFYIENIKIKRKTSLCLMEDETFNCDLNIEVEAFSYQPKVKEIYNFKNL